MIKVKVWTNLDLSETHDNPHSPQGILHGGAHFDDVGPSTLRALRRSETEGENQNARDKLHRMVVDGGYRRPAVNV